jgi:transposase
MFVKITKSKEFKYVQVVNSYRDNGKVKHEMLCNLGRLDQLRNNPAWQKIAINFAKLTGLETIDQPNNTNCSEANIVNWGYIIYKKLWDKLKLQEVLNNIQLTHKRVKFDLNNAVFLMVIQHLLCPSSKLRTFNKQQNYINLPKIEDLNYLYRSLDILHAEKDFIESHVFKMNRKLYNMQVDVVFYDVTTFHFESVKKDSLRNFGFSKNNKLNEVQVVFSMYIDREGRPIGYELFSGNTFEGKTLESALESIEKKFGIRNVIIVADRGLNSKLNLKKITDKKYGYIVASKIKSMPKTVQKDIFSKEGYTELSNNSEEHYCYKVIDYINKIKDQDSGDEIELLEKLIITYSSKRARKDLADRQRLLDKANFLLQNKSLIKSSSKRGGKKYLKETTKTDWTLDANLIAKDQQFDGFYGIQTNTTDNLSIEEILSAYHGLWKIEENFKILKSTLEVRPIFHWTEERIKGHFVVCFLSFLLEKTLEIKLKRAEIAASVQDIRDALNSLRFAEIEFNKQKLLIKTKNTELASKILRNLKIPPPKNITLSTNLNI